MEVDLPPAFLQQPGRIHVPPVGSEVEGGPASIGIGAVVRIRTVAQQYFDDLRVPSFSRQLNRHGTASPARVVHGIVDYTLVLLEDGFDGRRVATPYGGTQPAPAHFPAKDRPT